MIIQRLFSKSTKESVKELLEKSYRPKYFYGNDGKYFNVGLKTNIEEVENSLTKHEAKAAKLRAKKEAGEQLKKNLKKGGKIALATGGAVAAGIGAKKLYDKKKAKKDDNPKK